VSVVPLPAVPAGQRPDGGGLSVADAVDRYLDGIQVTTTRASYAETLACLTAIAGSRDAGTLQPGDYAGAMARWDGAAAATWNRHLSALTSFTAWAQRNEILATNPARRLERRKPARRGDRSIPRARLEKLFTDDWQGLRERVLWRMLYETAARAEEILTLNIEDLDPEFRRARVTSKGGAIEYVHWATGTSRLLPRLLRGRTAGGVPRRPARTRRRTPRTRRRGHLPGHRTGPAVLPARRVPVQAGKRTTRPAQEGLDPAPATPLGPPAPGRRRPHRSRASGQVPPPAPGQPRPLCPARRTDLRPRHRRGRSSRPPPHPLTSTATIAPRTGPPVPLE
jgi:integrase